MAKADGGRSSEPSGSGGSSGGPSSFAAFAAILQNAQHADVPTRLDVHSGQGTAFQFAQVCLARAEEARLSIGSAGGRGGNGGTGSSLIVVQNEDEVEWDQDGDALGWEMEARTWLLIGLLSAERYHQRKYQPQQQRNTRPSLSKGITHDEEPETAAMSFSSNPYDPPISRAQTFIASPSTQLSELNVIREWLQAHVLPVRHPIEVRQGYWTFTKHKLRNAQRTGAMGLQPGVERNAAGISLDPDFPNRASSAPSGSANTSTTLTSLSFEDATYETASWRFLFELARHGRLDLCFDMARQMNAHWKAASLRGGLLYSDPALLGTGMDEDDAYQDGDTAGLVGLEKRAMGNRNRALWKAVCRRIASGVASAHGSAGAGAGVGADADAYERALYGSLGGDLRSVLAVSHSWEEQLWAYVNASFEAKLDRLLTSPVSGSDASAGANPEEAAQDNWWYAKEGCTTGREMIGIDGDSSIDESVKMSLKAIFDRLEQTQTDGIYAQANDPFRTFQRYLILNTTDSLLAQVDERLRLMRTTLTRAQYARFVRFFAHYILFARLIRTDADADGQAGQPPEAGTDSEAARKEGSNSSSAELAANAILRLYVELLEEAGQDDDLIALYASSLDSQNAVDSYAQYLKSIDVNTDIGTRRSALLRAKDHDLDLPAVARRTVALVFDDSIPMVPSLLEEMGHISSFELGLSPVEERLIKAVDWLGFDAATYEDYIVESNALMRLFLSSGRLHAARTLLFSLSQEIVGMAAGFNLPGEQSTEHLQWHSFFDALNQHDRFVQIWSERKNETSTTRTEKAKWDKAVAHACGEAYRSAMQVFEQDWLKLDIVPETAADEERLEQLARMRKIYIPDLIFRLHNMFFDTSELLRDNLASALQLANVVADERMKLYLEFIWPKENKLKEYLTLVREASLAQLEDSSMDGNVFKAVERAPKL
ncbi:nuclear pore protein 84/107 [Tilletiaria anomala UBC 951]|uniref:Nuclear pore complex protein n=1 Tax=Tilletiaria anomala (strain ATCC 24038 / CBS 436.72 / UBC 951) TaxID=1037660 RepID=A0A066WEQ6_TILAU|nr:nuclear pore protein 84/107 [Tilletiaria anomala UBC 951]KDN52246.1 nuclear pore protein 84/107 [Tilletiaria anomala UBC 951]